jgi:hypothetical protein
VQGFENEGPLEQCLVDTSQAAKRKTDSKRCQDTLQLRLDEYGGERNAGHSHDSPRAVPIATLNPEDGVKQPVVQLVTLNDGDRSSHISQ